MGFAYKGFCYTTQAEAAEMACGREYPQQGTQGNTLYVYSCTGINASNQLLITRTANGGSATNFTVSTGFPTCDTLEYPSEPINLSLNSGGAIGGALLMVMAVAFVLRMARQALAQRYESEN